MESTQNKPVFFACTGCPAVARDLQYNLCRQISRDPLHEVYLKGGRGV